VIKHGSGIFFICFFSVCSPGFLFAEVPIGAISPADARERLVAAAEEYRGVPYRYGGIDRRGLDCSGLVILSFRDALSTASPRTSEEIEAWAEKIPESQLQRGDLVFFNTDNNTRGRASHLGIYVGEGRFIHAASEGPHTGVIYSLLEVPYWRRSFIGAGRVLPPVSETEGRRPSELPGIAVEGGGQMPKETGRTGISAFRLGVGMGASWNAFIADSSPFRGLAGQLQLSYAPNFFSFGVELRPEWDNALGIFRLPLALSVGAGDLFHIFAGPAITLGTPVIHTSDGDRRYIDKFLWIGTAGITLAPLVFKTAKGKLALYGELAWQSYFRESGLGANSALDTGVALRISTGLRFDWVM
jgi:probable lipoprotein NlpC